MNKIAISLAFLCLLLSSHMETARSDAFDCYDGCSTACVQQDQRLTSRCDRKCSIRCGPDGFVLGFAFSFAVIFAPISKMSGTDETSSRGLHVLRPPINPADRVKITLRPPPLDTDFGEVNNKVVKTISGLCLQNWPEPKITWASAPDLHKRLVWESFEKYYTWEPAHHDRIYQLFCAKASERTKDNLKNARDNAKRKATQDNSDMKAHKPKWCSQAVWAGMCDLWGEEGWRKKTAIASKNRASGAAEGSSHAPPTYRGCNITQTQHYASQESQPGQQRDWLDVYVATHHQTIPSVQEIADKYKAAMDARYPPGEQRPAFDLELWERASVVKKNYVRGLGQRRKYPSTCSSSSSSYPSQSSEACSHPPAHSAADCLQAVISDPSLLARFGVMLSRLSPEQLATAAAEADAEAAARAAEAAAPADAADDDVDEGTQDLS